MNIKNFVELFKHNDYYDFNNTKFNRDTVVRETLTSEHFFALFKEQIESYSMTDSLKMAATYGFREESDQFYKRYIKETWEKNNSPKNFSCLLVNNVVPRAEKVRDFLYPYAHLFNEKHWEHFIIQSAECWGKDVRLRNMSTILKYSNKNFRDFFDKDSITKAFAKNFINISYNLDKENTKGFIYILKELVPYFGLDITKNIDNTPSLLEQIILRNKSSILISAVSLLKKSKKNIVLDNTLEHYLKIMYETKNSNILDFLIQKTPLEKFKSKIETKNKREETLAFFLIRQCKQLHYFDNNAKSFIQKLDLELSQLKDFIYIKDQTKTITVLDFLKISYQKNPEVLECINIAESRLQYELLQTSMVNDSIKRIRRI